MDKPETLEDWENIKWQVAHKNIQVILDNEDSWCIEFLTPCDEMDDSGKCRVYDKRPAMCKKHSPENCIVNGDGDYYKVIFKCIENVENYLEKHPNVIKEDEDEPTECPKCGHVWVEEDDNEEE